MSKKVPILLLLPIGILNWFILNLLVIIQILSLLFICGAIVYYIIHVIHSNLIELLLILTVISLFFYFYITFIKNIYSYRFQLIFQQKLLVIMALLVSTFSLQEYNTQMKYFEFLRIFTFISVLIFIYDEYRKSYFGLYSNQSFNWRFEYIVWIIMFLSIMIIYNPLFFLTLNSRDVWRFLDVMGSIFLIFSILRDLKIGEDLVFIFYKYKDAVEKHGEEIPRKRLFICYEYGFILDSKPYIECSVEHKDCETAWTKEEEMLLDVNESDLWDSSIGIKRSSVKNGINKLRS